MISRYNSLGLWGHGGRSFKLADEGFDMIALLYVSLFYKLERIIYFLLTDWITLSLSCHIIDISKHYGSEYAFLARKPTYFWYLIFWLKTRFQESVFPQQYDTKCMIISSTTYGQLDGSSLLLGNKLFQLHFEKWQH